MSIESKFVKQKRRNKNRHYRAALNPGVRKLIVALRKGWADMGAVERGQRINKLVSTGCSKRGLETDLDIPESTIGRYAKIAKLPESDRKAIDSGQSAKKILIANQAAKLEREMGRRIDQDKRTGALSDEIASIILEFCRTGYGPRKERIFMAMLPALLDNVGSYLRKFEQTDRRALKAAKKYDPRELFRKTRPRAGKDRTPLAYRGEWLAGALWLIAPESSIRAEALIKVSRRAKELLPRRTLPEMVKDMQVDAEKRMTELTHLPSRKIFPGGARVHMKRQDVTLPSEQPDGSTKRDNNP
jgi:hypothetical protein